MNGVSKMREITRQPSEEMKYLGGILDKKLPWNKQAEAKMKRILGLMSYCAYSLPLLG